MALVTGQLCGLEECASSCHQPGHLGPYCAPLRCYCGGCPAFVPVDRGQPVTQAELDARAAAEKALMAARRAAAVPLDRAPPEVQAIRAQLRRNLADTIGPARWQALQERRARDAHG